MEVGDSREVDRKSPQLEGFLADRGYGIWRIHRSSNYLVNNIINMFLPALAFRCLFTYAS